MSVETLFIGLFIFSSLVLVVAIVVGISMWISSASSNEVTPSEQTLLPGQVTPADQAIIVCPKCGSIMEEGFLPDKLSRYGHLRLRWAEGKP